MQSVGSCWDSKGIIIMMFNDTGKGSKGTSEAEKDASPLPGHARGFPWPSAHRRAPCMASVSHQQNMFPPLPAMPDRAPLSQQTAALGQMASLNLRGQRRMEPEDSRLLSE